MSYRNGNYSAFYVNEPFDESNLGAHQTKDFCYYNMLKMWKGQDSSFPFIDSHGKTYNVRDGSDWEGTLKPRLHKRLDNSKNIVLFLSSITKSSRALREEIDYGINNQRLPVIVIYPEYKTQDDLQSATTKDLKRSVKSLWDKLLVFRDSMDKVPTLHVPLSKSLIEQALRNVNFAVQQKRDPDIYSYWI